MSDDYREAHQQSVTAAAEAIDNLRGALAAAEDGRQEIEGMVSEVVGDATTDAAQSVRGVLAETGAALDELRRLLAVAASELERYRNGF